MLLLGVIKQAMQLALQPHTSRAMTIIVACKRLRLMMRMLEFVTRFANCR